MTEEMNVKYAIINARAVLADRVFEGSDIIVEDGAISSIRASGGPIPVDARVLDADGGYVMPGFVDIHADYIEHMASPRPTSIMDFRMSLREAERELATHGITTMFHSLSLYGTSDFDVKPIRAPENTRKFIEIIEAAHRSSHLIRHRFHARFEIDNLARTEELEGYLRSRRIHLVSFMDHSPGQGQYRDLETFRKTLKGYRELTDLQIDRIIEERTGTSKLSAERIAGLAALAREHGISIASHDDDSVEKLELVSGFGSTISEFPISLEVAREARRMGMRTVAGAPNVLLGGSHAGNLSAREAILDGSIDILCSDYYPAAILHAIFKLHREDALGLAGLVRMATLNPAQAVGLGAEIGSIEVGKRADLIVVETVDGDFPVCTAVLVDGRVVISSHYRRAA
jgi:alpha-D-ribose 1-methylphosphonate 5-triphosphate diphosphatase